MSLLRTGGADPTRRAVRLPRGNRPLRDGLIPLARRHRRMLGRGLLFTALLVGARLALPLPLTEIVDHSASLRTGSSSPVWLLAAGFVSLALVAGLAEHHQRLAFAHFAGRSIGDGRDAALAAVQRDEGDASGDLTTQVVGDSLRVKQGLKGVLNHITVNGLLVVGVCAALALTDVRLGVVQLSGAIVLSVLAVAGAIRVARVAAEHRDSETELARSVHRLAARQGADDQAATVSAVRDLDAESGAADTAMTRWEGLTTWAVHVVLAGTGAVVLTLGVSSVQAGEMSTGTLFAVMAYLLVLHGPAIRFARQITRTAPLLVSARQLGLVLCSANPCTNRTDGRQRSADPRPEPTTGQT
jgi:ABC-type multidrug transport system fused ATPase/permease subunit